MDSKMEVAKHILFDETKLNVANVKLFPGTERDVSAGDMAQQITKALAQIDAGDYEVLVDGDDD